MKDELPWDEPSVFTVENCRVVQVSGGARARAMEHEIEERSASHGEKARMIDSWHGGMNPEARMPTAENPSLVGATSSPALMHFHLGRLKEPLSLGILNHRVEVDGKKIYEGGRLLILDGPAIREAADRYGVTEEMGNREK